MSSRTAPLLVALGIATAALALAHRGPAALPVSPGEATRRPERLPSAPSGANRELMNRLATLEDRQETLDQQIEAMRGQEPTRYDPAPGASLRTAEAVLDALDQAEQAERRDPVWADQAEADIQMQLRRGALPAAELLDVACMTSFCRLELSLDLAQFDDPLGVPLDQACPWPSQTFYQYDLTTGEAVLYLSREGRALPTRG